MRKWVGLAIVIGALAAVIVVYRPGSMIGMDENILSWVPGGGDTIIERAEYICSRGICTTSWRTLARLPQAETGYRDVVEKGKRYCYRVSSFAKEGYTISTSEPTPMVCKPPVVETAREAELF